MSAKVTWSSWTPGNVVDDVRRKLYTRMPIATQILQSAIRSKANVDTGAYMAQIETSLKIEGNSVTGRVSSKAPQTMRLEFGFVGTDSLGRNYNQAPNPHWRPAIAATQGAILKVLTD